MEVRFSRIVTILKVNCQSLARSSIPRMRLDSVYEHRLGLEHRLAYEHRLGFRTQTGFDKTS